MNLTLLLSQSVNSL